MSATGTNTNTFEEKWSSRFRGRRVFVAGHRGMVGQALRRALDPLDAELSTCHYVGTGMGWRSRGLVLVEVDPRYFRPTEVDAMQGDASKARLELGWQPTVGFPQLAVMMVDADLAAAREAC